MPQIVRFRSNFVHTLTVAKPVYYICSRSKVKGQGHGVEVQGQKRENVTYIEHRLFDVWHSCDVRTWMQILCFVYFNVRYRSQFSLLIFQKCKRWLEAMPYSTVISTRSGSAVLSRSHGCSSWAGRLVARNSPGLSDFKPRFHRLDQQVTFRH